MSEPDQTATAALQKPFQSHTAIRAAHAVLVRKRRSDGEGAEFMKKVTDFVERGAKAGAILDDARDRQGVQSLLDYWDNFLVRKHHQRPDTTLAAFDPSLAPVLQDEDCPYVGLAPFSEETADFFYGRERLTTKLINELQRNRFLALVGPSGSGKSSVILAGVVPRLKSESEETIARSREWTFFKRVVPGANPLLNLTLALQKEAQQPINLVELMKTSDKALLEILNQHFAQGSLLVIDQFEEAFTLCIDRDLRQAFIRNLTQVLAPADGLHHLIITMRIDFEAFVSRHPDFNDLYEDNLIRLLPLQANELRAAIEKPAEKVGLKFEHGVVDSLMQDILGEPAALPLLQFTLLKLWEERQRNRITWAAYQRLGGGRKALARSADELYQKLPIEEQITAKRILLRMVFPGEGLEVTNNRVKLLSIYEIGEARDRVERVLNKLVKGHLVRITSDGHVENAQVEVAHEALVRNWPTLVDWLDEKRVTIRQRLRLTAAAEEWGEHHEEETYLWRGSQLAEAGQIQDLSPLEKRFVEASQNAEKAAQFAQEEALRKELEQAEALREETARRARIIRIALGWVLALVAVTTFAAFYALSEQRTAEANLEIAAEIAIEQEENAINSQANASTLVAEREEILAVARETSMAIVSKATAVQSTAEAALASLSLIQQQLTRTPTPSLTPRPDVTLTPTPSVTPTPTIIPSPTVTLTPSSTPAPVNPILTVNTALINIRSDPDVSSSIIGTLREGEQARVIGRSEEGGVLYWKIECPKERVYPQCWVYGGDNFVSVSGE